MPVGNCFKLSICLKEEYVGRSFVQRCLIPWLHLEGSVSLLFVWCVLPQEVPHCVCDAKLATVLDFVLLFGTFGLRVQD